MLNRIEYLAPLAMALLAGAVLPFQATANATVGRLMRSPLWGALISLCVSLLVILPTMAVFRVPAPNLGSVVQGPWWLWVGGVIGALYVAVAASVIPRLGAGGFLVCVVAGQMVAAVLVDHFGLMGLATRPLTVPRIAGVVLMLVGVFLIQGLDRRAALPLSGEGADAVAAQRAQAQHRPVAR